MVNIIKKKLITLRFSDNDADKIYKRACNKGMTVGQYLKWYIQSNLGDYKMEKTNGK